MYTSHTHTCSGEGGELASKKDFINTARLIAKESDEVVKMAKKVAAACTDKRMKRVGALHEWTRGDSDTMITVFCCCFSPTMDHRLCFR